MTDRTDRDVLLEIAKAIDWNQQDGSCYTIGEDAAELLLMHLNFDWNQGMNNEAVALLIETELNRVCVSCDKRVGAFGPWHDNKKCLEP